MQEKQQQAEKSKLKIVSSEYFANVTGHRGINLLKDYDEADEEDDCYFLGAHVRLLTRCSSVSPLLPWSTASATLGLRSCLIKA